MEALTVFVDGPAACPEFVEALKRELSVEHPGKLSLATPAAPNRAAFQQMLAHARQAIAPAPGFEEPTPEMMSAMATVELLEIARMMLCNIERSWCVNAVSGSLMRVNLCIDSELNASLQTLHDDDVSDECKDMVRAICRIGPKQGNNILHLYVGDTATVECAAYVEMASSRELQAATVDNLADAVAAVSSKITKDLHTPAFDAHNFL